MQTENFFILCKIEVTHYVLAELIPNTNGSSLTFYRLDEQHIQYKRQGKKLAGPKAWKRIGVDTYLPTIGLIDINGDERSDCDNADGGI